MPDLCSVATVLVVEDDDSVRDMLIEVLQESGYTVEAAADGQDGLRVLGGPPPGVALVDLRMPGMTGIEFAQRLHAAPQYASVPVILMSAESKLRDMMNVLQPLGVNDVLIKPFEISALLSSVERCTHP